MVIKEINTVGSNPLYLKEVEINGFLEICSDGQPNIWISDNNLYEAAKQFHFSGLSPNRLHEIAQ